MVSQIVGTTRSFDELILEYTGLEDHERIAFLRLQIAALKMLTKNERTFLEGENPEDPEYYGWLLSLAQQRKDVLQRINALNWLLGIPRTGAANIAAQEESKELEERILFHAAFYSAFDLETLLNTKLVRTFEFTQILDEELEFVTVNSAELPGYYEELEDMVHKRIGALNRIIAAQRVILQREAQGKRN